MRTNGFILAMLTAAAAALAGAPGYLPKVGPVALHFQKAETRSASPTERAAALPPLYPPAPLEPPTDPEQPPTSTVPAESMTNAVVPSPATNPPVVIEITAVSPTNAPGPLIGPAAETNGVVSPQIFLRYFTPGRVGPATEAFIVPPADFNPALPPPTSAPASRATYRQPDP